MIHPTAIVHPGAELAADVEVGPYAVIGEHVKIGRGTKIGAHAVIDGWTTIGEENQIFQMAAVGAAPQDLKYKGEETLVIIGDRNVIREFATIHRGTMSGRRQTVVGSGNMLMAYSHVAHDCILGDGIVMANATALAGHVTVDSFAILGGLVAIHQFVRIGGYVMIGGGTMVGHDIPPFTIAATCDKRDASLRGLNLIGLKRRGFSPELITDLKRAYRILAFSKLKLPEALAKMKSDLRQSPELSYFIEFIEKSERGICRP
ncbi:MAG: acyl-ACP--UDP-N-acetylglucosamine O-acyltransferase [Geobacter sp.]|nr:acyl-ACP--UDP-N-acetylglucosamine O-acyltransferase [Geobacter sp.]